MNGTAISSECGIGLEVGAKSTHLDAFIRKATRYIVMMSAVTVIQVKFLLVVIPASSQIPIFLLPRLPKCTSWLLIVRIILPFRRMCILESLQNMSCRLQVLWCDWACQFYAEQAYWSGLHIIRVDIASRWRQFCFLLECLKFNHDSSKLNTEWPSWCSIPMILASFFHINSLSIWEVCSSSSRYFVQDRV